MILTCPSCGTQYVVKDGAIPPEGRQVRCASCKHSWHQDPEYSELASEPGGDPPLEAEPPAADEEESVAEATLIEPRSGPEAEERAYEEAMIDEAGEAQPEASVDTAAPTEPEPQEDWREPPEAEAESDTYSPFAAESEVEPARRSPLLTILMVVILIAALAAAFWFLAPVEWKARLGLAAAGASPLALVTTHMDRRPLESGQDLLTVTGRVINPTNQEQVVPPLQAQLRSHAGKVVYKWTITPPARTLPPGASASFNSAEVNVPAGADELTITLGNPKA